MKCNIFMFILAMLPITVFSQNNITELEGHWVLEKAVVTNLNLGTKKADSILYFHNTEINGIGKNSFFVKDIIKDLTIVDAENQEYDSDQEIPKSYLKTSFEDFIAEIEINGDQIIINDPRKEEKLQYEYTYQLISNEKLLLQKNSLTFKNDFGKRIEQSFKIYLGIKQK